MYKSQDEKILASDFYPLFGLGYVQWSDWTPEGLPERGTAN